MSEDQFRATVGVCTYSQVKTRAVVSHFGLEQCPNPTIKVHYQDGDALISRSRSVVANNFLNKTKDDMLMFLDEDIVISTMDATKLMWEAKKLDLPIVGAAYPTKSKRNCGLAIFPIRDEKVTFGKNGGLYEMRRLSTGCMCIKREVFEKMIEKGIVNLCVGGNGGSYYSFFKQVEEKTEVGYEDLSEDWWFCEKARELGFKIWCDTTIKLGHIGFYEYTWDDVFETRTGVRKEYKSIVLNMQGSGTRKSMELDVDLTKVINKDKTPFLGNFRQDIQRILQTAKGEAVKAA